MIPAHIKQLSCDEIQRDEKNADLRITQFVVQELATLVPTDARIITFDGFNGVGKTTLGRKLAQSLDLPIVELDSYLNKHQDRFLDALDFSSLSKVIVDARDNAGRVVVEGCLVESALERLTLQSNFRIYVMRTSRMHGNAHDEWVTEHDTLYGDSSTEELIDELKDLAHRASQMPEEFGGGGSGDPSSLDQELVRYHRAVRPQDHADVIVKMIHWS